MTKPQYKYIEAGDPLAESVPYLFMDNARLACVHEFGGTMERRTVDYQPFVAWYDWLALQSNIPRSIDQLAAEHAFAITFGDSFVPGRDEGGDKFHISPFTSTIERDPALWVPMPFHAPWLVVVRLDKLTHEATIEGFMRRAEVLAAPMHDIIQQRKIMLAALTRSVHDDVCRFCGGRRVRATTADDETAPAAPTMDAFSMTLPAKTSRRKSK